jgi:hypothetical protein
MIQELADKEHKKITNTFPTCSPSFVGITLFYCVDVVKARRVIFLIKCTNVSSTYENWYIFYPPNYSLFRQKMSEYTFTLRYDTIWHDSDCTSSNHMHPFPKLYLPFVSTLIIIISNQSVLQPYVSNFTCNDTFLRLLLKTCRKSKLTH